PDGRERIELPAHKGTEELPQQRVAHRGVSREAREASPDCHSVDHVGSKRIRTSRPGFVPSIAAALPPLIAIDRLRYESSYRIRSPGLASANVRAASA